MESNPPGGVLLQKTRDLCQALTEMPEFQSIRSRLAGFQADAAVVELFETLNLKGSQLQAMQQAGRPLSAAEVEEFERLQAVLLQNPVAQGFLSAQQEMAGIHEMIGQYVLKTFELGRVPRLTELMEPEEATDPER